MFANRSLVKYKLVIDDFGGWPLFPANTAAFSVTLAVPADIASVATAAMLERPGVAAAIVGATNVAHLQAHAKIGALALDAQDRAAIASVTERRSGPTGDVYELERDRTMAAHNH